MGEKILNKSKAVLVSVCLRDEDYLEKEYSLDELERLADTAGVEVMGKYIQKRSSINPALYLGGGFLKSIREEMEDLDAGLMIFDNELSPTQGRNITKEFEIEVIDRTEVILNIFHDHARTNESKLQVKLAELKYQLPRLKKLWSHFEKARVAAGTGKGPGQAARGMGEKQIEIDRRLIRLEIRKINKLLEKIEVQKRVQRQGRADVKKVCLVGYTNAGKSTLFNRLTGEDVLAEDKLFATLDSTARSINFGKGRDVILSDTVGFIADLPHHLVASFHATLKEVIDADLLLHVIDISDEMYTKHIKDVDKVLNEINAGHIPQLIVFNKIDNGDIDTSFLPNIYDGCICISARTGEGIDRLEKLIDKNLNKSYSCELLIPHAEQKDIARIFKYGKILKKEYLDNGFAVRAILNKEDFKPFEKYIVKSSNL